MEWMKGEELLETIKKYCSLIAGMGLSEAARSIGCSTMANGTLIKPVINSTAAQIIQFPGATAAEAYAVGGTVATGAATSTAANLTLVNTTAGATAAGSSSAAGVLSVAAPIALSALSAVGGYLIGNEIYEHNQEFFDELLEPVNKFIYDGTQNFMALFDSNGYTYLDKRAYDILKEKLDSIPSTSELVIPTGSISLSTLEITNKIFTPALDGLNWQISKGYNKYAQHQNYQYDCVVEALQKACNWVETMLPNYKMLGYLDYIGAGDYSRLNGIVLTIIVYKTSTSCYFNTEKDSINNKNYTVFNFIGEYASLQITSSETDLGERTIFTVEEPQYGRLYYYCNSYIDNTLNLHWITSSNTVKYPVEPAGRMPYFTNFTYQEVSGLPNGVKKYNPNIAKNEPIYLIHGWNDDGSPIEVPYIPVRLPSNPRETPIPNEEDDPSGDPEVNPNIVTPYIPTEVPYPSGTPIVAPKPAPTPEENPDNLPYQLPNPIPDTNPEPAIEPNPEVDPSISPEPAIKPNQVPINDPTTNPESSGTTPPVIIPTIPTISSTATGLLHVYNPTNSQINEFGTWLWTTFSGDLIDTISKLFNNPMDGVIGVHELYATPSRGSESTIKCGFLDSGITSRLVDKRYTEINCGSIIVPEHWGNYLDYAPYTKAHCYLPFIGMVELNADDIIGHAVNITYKIDAYTGACIAVITVASSGYESICYQFPGNCAVEVPITSGMKSVLQSALIGAATTAIGAAVGGAAGAALGGASAGAIASTAATRGGAGAITGAAYGARAKNDVQHSGSFGSSFGAMGCKKPFLVIKRPKQKVVAGYNKNYGYPAHKMVTIGSCSGYLRAREVDVVSVTATEDEKKLIEEALKSGVFVS